MKFSDLLKLVDNKETLLSMKDIIYKKRLFSISCYMLVLAYLFNLGLYKDNKPQEEVMETSIESIDLEEPLEYSNNNKVARVYLRDELISVAQEEPIPEEPLDIMEDEFVINYDELSLMEKQEYIISNYGVSYETLMLALSYELTGETIWNFNYEEVEVLRNREDYKEIIDLFLDLTIEKENYVLTSRGLEFDKWEVVAKTILKEAGENFYDECYLTANSLDNRTHCSRWVNAIDKVSGEGAGFSLYYQIIHPNQYTVYLDGIYKKLTQDLKSYIGYYALLDYFVSMESRTNYMSFNIAGSGVGEQLVPGGDEFREELTDKERIDNPTITLGEADSLKLD